MPGCGIRANDQTIVSHHLPVKFLVRLEALKVKFKGSVSFEFKKARWRAQNFTDEWWRDSERILRVGSNPRKAWRSHEICAYRCGT